MIVIEDNIDAADTLGEALEFSGHDAQVAYEGPSGIERATFRPEVLLSIRGTTSRIAPNSPSA